LRELVVFSNPLTDAAARALLAPPWPKLEELHVNRNVFSWKVQEELETQFGDRVKFY